MENLPGRLENTDIIAVGVCEPIGSVPCDLPGPEDLAETVIK
jgi:hypothetical protein